MPVLCKVPCDKCFVLTHPFFVRKIDPKLSSHLFSFKTITQEPVLDPAGGVMSDLITQDPLWLPTVYNFTRNSKPSGQMTFIQRRCNVVTLLRR